MCSQNVRVKNKCLRQLYAYHIDSDDDNDEILHKLSAFAISTQRWKNWNRNNDYFNNIMNSVEQNESLIAHQKEKQTAANHVFECVTEFYKSKNFETIGYCNLLNKQNYWFWRRHFVSISTDGNADSNVNLYKPRPENELYDDFPTSFEDPEWYIYQEIYDGQHIADVGADDSDDDDSEDDSDDDDSELHVAEEEIHVDFDVSAGSSSDNIFDEEKEIDKNDSITEQHIPGDVVPDDDESDDDDDYDVDPAFQDLQSLVVKCKCRHQLKLFTTENAAKSMEYTPEEFICDKCEKSVIISANAFIFHCTRNTRQHSEGYDLCTDCAREEKEKN